MGPSPTCQVPRPPIPLRGHLLLSAIDRPYRFRNNPCRTTLSCCESSLIPPPTRHFGFSSSVMRAWSTARPCAFSVTNTLPKRSHRRSLSFLRARRRLFVDYLLGCDHQDFEAFCTSRLH